MRRVSGLKLTAVKGTDSGIKNVLGSNLLCAVIADQVIKPLAELIQPHRYSLVNPGKKLLIHDSITVLCATFNSEVKSVL